MQKKNIVLIGFMGTGKSTTGRLLAGRLGRPFIDIDRKIEFEYKQTIKDMFEHYGEKYFRKKEYEVIGRVSRYTNAVIATGGGAVLLKENMDNLKKNGILICLTADIEVILERTSRRNNRPLLQNEAKKDQIIELLQSREALYQIADFTVDTSSYTPQQVVSVILEKLRLGGYYLWKYK